MTEHRVQGMYCVPCLWSTSNIRIEFVWWVQGRRVESNPELWDPRADRLAGDRLLRCTLACMLD